MRWIGGYQGIFGTSQGNYACMHGVNQSNAEHLFYTLSTPYEKPRVLMLVNTDFSTQKGLTATKRVLRFKKKSAVVSHQPFSGKKGVKKFSVYGTRQVMGAIARAQGWKN